MKEDITYSLKDSTKIFIVKKNIYLKDFKTIKYMCINSRCTLPRSTQLRLYIKGILGRVWEVTTYHVHREVNCVADWLANYELTRDLLDRGSDVLKEPPSGLYPLLYYDLIRSTFTRSIQKVLLVPIITKKKKRLYILTCVYIY